MASRARVKRKIALNLRIAEWSVPQLKTWQECITLAVFTVVAFALLGATIK